MFLFREPLGGCVGKALSLQPAAAFAVLHPDRNFTGSSRHILLFGGAVLAAHALALRGDLHQAEGTGYLCTAAVLLIALTLAVQLARRASRPMQIRWHVFLAALLAGALSYIFADAGRYSWFAITTTTPISLALDKLSEGLLLLCAMQFASGSRKAANVLDLCQIALFVGLRFYVTWWPSGKIQFAAYHLQTNEVVGLFLFLTAFTASFGATSREELRFLRMLSIFLGLRSIGLFFGDQVSYIWLHHAFTSWWDLLVTVSELCFVVFLARTLQSPAQDRSYLAPANPPSVFVRSLMPAFLAISDIAIGLYAMRRSVAVGAVAVGAGISWYAIRTALLHAQAGTERERLRLRNHMLEQLADQDALTGLGNRRFLTTAFAALLDEQPGEIALLLMDADCFKQANDRFGHQYGDDLLIALSHVLHDVCESVSGSLCARYGGDEFALLAPCDPTQALELAEDIRLRVDRLALSVGDGTLTVSIGVAWRSDHRDLPSLLRRADEALYRAKAAGRNRVGGFERIAVAHMAEISSSASGLASVDLLVEATESAVC